MGGQACGVLPRVFLLVDFHTSGRLWGCGWVEHDARSCTGSARCWVLRRHLPVGGLFFLVAAPGLDRLTHPVGAPCRGGGCGGGCGGFRGVVVC